MALKFLGISHLNSRTQHVYCHCVRHNKILLLMPKQKLTKLQQNTSNTNENKYKINARTKEHKFKVQDKQILHIRDR